MKARRPFIPAAPNYAALEDRLAPTNIFGLGTWWDHRMADLGFEHYKHHGAQAATVGVASPASAKALAHHVKAVTPSTSIFK